MNEKALILERNIANDLAAIETIYAKIGAPTIGEDTEQDALIVLAYHLHSLYVVFENIFLRVAEVFENQLDDQARWHQQLLLRMKLDLTPLRPAVIDDATYDNLDELRRFRHLFRTAYQVQFDPRRLQLVVEKALILKSRYPQQFQVFLAYLQSLQ